MASIVAYKENCWRVFIERHGIRKTKTFHDREAAEKWGAELEAMTQKQLRGLCTLRERFELAQTALVTSIPPRVLEANAAIPYKHAEILEAAIPNSKPSGVYFLVKGPEVVYVGQSLDMLHRIARHRREGRDFDGFACLECEPEKLDELEAQYIAAFAPRWNVSFGRPLVTRAAQH
jgi:hypothetical protein